MRINVCYLIPGHLSYSDTPKEEGEVRMEQDSWPWHSSCAGDQGYHYHYQEAVRGEYGAFYLTSTVLSASLIVQERPS